MHISRSKVAGAFAALSLVVLGTACGSDDSSSKNNNNTGGATSGGGSGGTGGSGGGTTGGSGGTAGSGTGATGGTAGGGGSTCDLSGTGKAKMDVPNPITADMTLTADTVWTVKDIVHVMAPATLTIEPCTRIEGTKTPIGVLVVTKGAKINAVGTENEPILFTSPQPVGSRAAGDWGGVILLGKSQTNDVDAVIEGLADAPENHYGGTDDADNSGTMSYVRIEYAGYELSPDNEVNGLTFGAVGSGTTINHIEVNQGLDDCYEWFGGSVNADHLICNVDGDDSFDTDRGYRGKLMYLFGRKRANPSADPNGFEWDNNHNDNAATPVSHPDVKHATLCGFGTDVGVTTYGGVFRRGDTGVIDDWVAVGFSYGVDTRDDVGTVANPSVVLTNGTLFDMLLSNIANAGETDNDNGFDEAAWFNAGSGNSTNDPGFNTADCQEANGPSAKVTGSGKGAFTDGNWLTGAWVDWTEK
jgi:hypothetical protein